MATVTSGPPPTGSALLGEWARRRRLKYEPYPNDDWFRAWEPYDTMVSATTYYNSVSWPLRSASVTHAEPWNAEPGSEPLDRTVLTFISHRGFRWRAAARGGEHFNTRVAFLENAPPPTVTVGDPHWDEHMVTFAASGSEAEQAFPPAVRKLLSGWGFSGHVEVRPGGLIVHWAGTHPTPEHFERLLPAVPKLLGAYFGSRP